MSSKMINELITEIAQEVIEEVKAKGQHPIAKLFKEALVSWIGWMEFQHKEDEDYYIGYWTNLDDTPYTKGEVNFAGWNSLDDLKRGKGKMDLSHYSCEEKYVRQYLKFEFPLQDIDQMMEWVSEYPDEISIEVEYCRWITGDEMLMNFIQSKLMSCDEDEDESEDESEDDDDKDERMVVVATYEEDEDIEETDTESVFLIPKGVDLDDPDQVEDYMVKDNVLVIFYENGSKGEDIYPLVGRENDDKRRPLDTCVSQMWKKTWCDAYDEL